MAIAIVLVEPEIPSNTGNIARTCVVTGSELHLVEPLGFSIEDKYLKRAGLDYWFDLNIKIWKDVSTCLSYFTDRAIFYATTKAEKNYKAVNFPEDAVLVFGKETKGLPEAMLQTHPERCIRLPMAEQHRSLNLANTVAVLTYEALSQNNFLELT